MSWIPSNERRTSCPYNLSSVTTFELGNCWMLYRYRNQAIEVLASHYCSSPKSFELLAELESPCCVVVDQALEYGGVITNAATSNPSLNYFPPLAKCQLSKSSALFLFQRNRSKLKDWCLITFLPPLNHPPCLFFGPPSHFNDLWLLFRVDPRRESETTAAPIA